MLRSQLGPDLFRQGIRTYVERHRNGIVTTDDLQQAVEDVSGLSFDQFFDQWVYHGGIPELKIEYSWDAGGKTARLSVRQTQKVSEKVPLFRLPLPVRFTLAGGATHESTLAVGKEAEDFYVVLPGAPEQVRIDPGFTVLAKVVFTPPGEMLNRQLTGGDMLGRFLAVQTLGDRKDGESARALGKVLAGDAFWAVRQEAVKALRRMNTPEAQRELLAAPPQADARVRLEWVEALGATFSPDSRARLVRLSQEEKNPRVLGAIISALSSALDWKVVDLLGKESRRQVISGAVIGTLRAQDREEAAPAVLARLRAAGGGFETRAYAQALDDLAFLARKQPAPDEVIEFLGGHLTHPRERFRSAAAKALGTLGHPRGLALLNPLTGTRKPFRDPVRDAAERAIREIESRRSGAPQVEGLIERIQAQQKRLEDLEKKLEALDKKTAPQK
jgi:aminopeptidase N